MAWKNRYFIIVIGIAVTGILIPVLNTSGSKTPDIKITESTFFDPLCKDKQIFSFDYICDKPTSNWSVSLGSSTNIDDYSNDDTNHGIILFIKIPLVDITSSSLSEITVTDAKLILRTTNETRNRENSDTKFAIYN
ncbi:MAG: hypothetical protein ACREAE_10085, partial [Nitrosopumilaceae archaeon]